MKTHLFREGQEITLCGIIAKAFSTDDFSEVDCKTCSGRFAVNVDWYKMLREAVNGSMGESDTPIFEHLKKKVDDRNKRRNLRIKKLKRGDYQFGHAGSHHGVGTEECPTKLHHHHDYFCQPPTFDELIDAGIDPDTFEVKSRA